MHVVFDEDCKECMRMYTMYATHWVLITSMPWQ